MRGGIALALPIVLPTPGTLTQVCTDHAYAEWSQQCGHGIAVMQVERLRLAFAGQRDEGIQHGADLGVLHMTQLREKWRYAK